jgi:hypothetical protein
VANEEIADLGDIRVGTFSIKST